MKEGTRPTISNWAFSPFSASFDLHNNPLGKVLLLSPSWNWGNRCTERVSCSSSHTAPEAGCQTHSGPSCCHFEVSQNLPEFFTFARPDRSFRMEIESHKSLFFHGFLFLLHDSVSSFLSDYISKPLSPYSLSSSYYSLLSVSRTDYATSHLRVLLHVVSFPWNALLSFFKWPESFSSLMSQLLKEWKINLQFYGFWEMCTARF